jgi:DNA-binding Lrp family transcriptional regulator
MGLSPKIGAYVFIECGNDPVKIVNEILKVPGVTQANALFGPLDAIAFVTADDLAAIERTVKEVQKVPGIRSTDTRIARGPATG